MSNYKIIKVILFLILFVFQKGCANANTIDIDTFYELMNSVLNNGYVYNLTNDLDSNESIGNHFFNYNINFDGNHYSIDGQNTYGGFILSRDNTFSEIEIKNCQGQLYNNSNFAGAIFNSGGQTAIIESDFNENFVSSGSVNYGVAGAVYNLNGGAMIIQNSNFNNNHATGAGSYGGAVANGYNDNGTAEMTINNNNFSNNYAEAEVFSGGGALYNNGIINIDNSSFGQNHIDAIAGERNQPFLYGGAINNNEQMTIKNTSFNGNYLDGGDNSISFGGAIYNNGRLEISSSSFNGNRIDSNAYGDGGAIYNNTNATLTIKDSILENNEISSSLFLGEGGAIYNGGTLTLEGTTLKDNKDKTDELNDIYNNTTAVLNFSGTGTNSVLSGIKGAGTINKTDSGILNLGGENSNFNGTFSFNQGTLNLLADSSYFQATDTNFGNDINFNMANGQINDLNFGNLNLAGTTNIFADMNFNNNTMDRINANSISGSGDLFVRGLHFEGTPEGERIFIPFADDVLKDSVSYTPSTIGTPIYNYQVSYNSSNGDFELFRQGFNGAILASEVAAQLGGYLTQIDTYKNIFANLDMVMISPPEIQTAFSRLNKTAYADKNFTFSPFVMPEQRTGIWFKPYSTFETVGLKNGPRVSNVSYGSMVGVESGLKKMENGWYALYGGYVSYNGSHQAYQGNSIYNNGGLLGLDAVFYKGKFFTAWTANVGATSSESSTEFGRDNFAMLNTGIAQMSGYNFETFKRKLIIQPAILASYSFINTFDYTTKSNVKINTRPLNAIQIEPRIKLIGNFKNFVQPYIAVSVVWNIIDSAKFKANDVYLPDLAIKPFVQYGAGIQKRWGDRVTGFFETMIRNGGRNGVALQFGLRISI